MPKVLVYGWYHQGNIGDELFMDAFKHLFPNFDFEFTEIITSKKLQDVDAVFFGGGSFLLGLPNIEGSALQQLKSKKIFYIGVGVETHIHPIHIELMKLAKLIATRSSNQISRLLTINPNVIGIPDLVHALQSKVPSYVKQKKTILVMPNICVVPKVSDAHWKHAAWTYFKSEFVQFLDFMSGNGHKIKFFPMCENLEASDTWASNELVSHMEKRHASMILLNPPKAFEEVISLVSQHELLITQRFHGIVLSEMAGTPHMSIHHHDKLKNHKSNSGQSISYYNSSKQLFIDTFNSILSNSTDSLPIESNTFEELIKAVISLI